jgi:hypothetical protein
VRDEGGIPVEKRERDDDEEPDREARDEFHVKRAKEEQRHHGQRLERHGQAEPGGRGFPAPGGDFRRRQHDERGERQIELGVSQARHGARHGEQRQDQKGRGRGGAFPGEEKRVQPRERVKEKPEDNGAPEKFARHERKQIKGRKDHGRLGKIEKSGVGVGGVGVEAFPPVGRSQPVGRHGGVLQGKPPDIVEDDQEKEEPESPGGPARPRRRMERARGHSESIQVTKSFNAGRPS